MKRYQDSNYYELLEVPRDATLQQIRAAYFLAKKTFGEKNFSTLSLFTEDERAAIWAKMEEAHQILSDFDKRRSYDIFLENGSDSPNPWKPLDPAPAMESPTTLPDMISGSCLKSIREKKRATLQSMVAHTRIAVNYLIAIEEDQFKNFPPEVYLKSYLSEYAKFLSLDPKKLAEGYLKYYHSTKKKTS